MIKAVITIALACTGIHAQTAAETQFTRADAGTLKGFFWNEATQNYWNKIAHPATALYPMPIAPDCRSKRILALEVGMFYDAKYKYDYSRPLLASQARDTENNRVTVRTAYWVPDGNFRANPPDPDAYVLIGPVHFRSGLTALFRRIL